MRISAVGGTDKMTAITPVGAVRTYARVAPDQPFTYEAWMEAVRRAETFVTYGPLLDFYVDGQKLGRSTVSPCNKSWTIVMSDTIPKLGPDPVALTREPKELHFLPHLLQGPVILICLGNRNAGVLFPVRN